MGENRYGTCNSVFKCSLKILISLLTSKKFYKVMFEELKDDRIFIKESFFFL